MGRGWFRRAMLKDAEDPEGQGLKPGLIFSAFSAVGDESPTYQSSPDTRPMGLGSWYPGSQGRDTGRPGELFGRVPHEWISDSLSTRTQQKAGDGTLCGLAQSLRQKHVDCSIGTRLRSAVSGDTGRALQVGA